MSGAPVVPRKPNKFAVHGSRFQETPSFVTYSKNSYYHAYYQQLTSFMKAMSAYAPRQVQLSMRFLF